jgi:hypothetical protein
MGIGGKPQKQTDGEVDNQQKRCVELEGWGFHKLEVEIALASIHFLHLLSKLFAAEIAGYFSGFFINHFLGQLFGGGGAIVFGELIQCQQCVRMTVVLNVATASHSTHIIRSDQGTAIHRSITSNKQASKQAEAGGTSAVLTF